MPDSSAQKLEIAQAVEILRSGGVIAIPTDTVYGLAASLEHPHAIERVYELKGRDPGQPLPVLIDSPRLMRRYGVDIPDTADRVAACFWPGAITIIIQASDAVPPNVLAGGSTVGLRIPDKALTLQLIGRAGGALAVTSANRSGMPEARSADQVRDIFGDAVDLVLNGGRLDKQAASTVLDLSGEFGIIRREGSITRSALSCIDGIFP